MGKKSRSRWKFEQEKLNRSPHDWRGNPIAGARTQAEADWIYQFGHKIESELVEALQQGYQLHSTGWAEMVYRDDFGGLLPLALQSYGARNPRDEIEYRGWNFKCHGYVIRIKPDQKWLNSCGLLPG